MAYLVEAAAGLWGGWSNHGVVETVLGSGPSLQTNRAYDRVLLPRPGQRFLRLRLSPLP